MSDIIIKDLCKSFGKKSVFTGFSANIEEGKTTCIMGGSGAGKTTLLRILAGLEKYDSGTIENLPDRLSFVFQEDRLCEDFSAKSNVKFVTGNSLSDEVIESRLTALGLGDSLDKPVKELSGGMKRRVALARALSYDNDLLILDEPFKGLDPSLRYEVMDYVKKQTSGKTVICVTHDSSEAEYLEAGILYINAPVSIPETC